MLFKCTRGSQTTKVCIDLLITASYIHLLAVMFNVFELHWISPINCIKLLSVTLNELSIRFNYIELIDSLTFNDIQLLSFTLDYLLQLLPVTIELHSIALYSVTVMYFQLHWITFPCSGAVKSLNLPSLGKRLTDEAKSAAMQTARSARCLLSVWRLPTAEPHRLDRTKQNTPL